jgi:hypothetical protein
VNEHADTQICILWSNPLLLAYSGTGQKERVLNLLEKAYADRSNVAVQIKVEPMYDPIRSDPRFQDLLRRVGLYTGRTRGIGSPVEA